MVSLAYLLNAARSEPRLRGGPSCCGSYRSFGRRSRANGARFFAYDSGWNRLTEKHYSKTEWPEAEVIAPLVNDGSYRVYPSSTSTSSCHAYGCVQTSFSSSFTESYTINTCTLVYNPISTTASTPTKIVANSSIIF